MAQFRCNFRGNPWGNHEKIQVLGGAFWDLKIGKYVKYSYEYLISCTLLSLTSMDLRLYASDTIRGFMYIFHFFLASMPVLNCLDMSGGKRLKGGIILKIWRGKELREKWTYFKVTHGNRKLCESMNIFCINMFIMVHVVKDCQIILCPNRGDESKIKVFHVEEELNKNINYHGNSVISLK